MAKQRFKRIVTVLAGVEQPNFVYEPALRLFQLKYALLYRKSQNNLDEAATLFSAIVLKCRSDGRSTSPANNLRRVLKEQDCRSLINHAEFDPIKLTEIPPLSAIQEAAAEKLPRMKFWVRLIEIRLQLIAHPKLNTKNKAYQLYEANFGGSPAAKGNGMETMKALHKKRPATEAYLIGIDEIFDLDEFFVISTDPCTLLAQLEVQAKDAGFRSAFANAAWVKSQLGREKQGNLISKWLGCDPIPIKVPGLLPEELAALKGA